MRGDPWKPLQYLSTIVAVGTVVALEFLPRFIRDTYGRAAWKETIGPILGFSMMLLPLSLLVGLYAFERSLARSFPSSKKRRARVDQPDPGAFRLLLEASVNSARRGSLLVADVDQEQAWGEPERAIALQAGQIAAPELTAEQRAMVQLGNELAVRMGRRRVLKPESYIGLLLVGMALSQLPQIVPGFRAGAVISILLLLVIVAVSTLFGRAMTSMRTRRRPFVADVFLASQLNDPQPYADALEHISHVERTIIPKRFGRSPTGEYAERYRRLEVWLRTRANTQRREPTKIRSGEASRPTAPQSTAHSAD